MTVPLFITFILLLESYISCDECKDGIQNLPDVINGQSQTLKYQLLTEFCSSNKCNEEGNGKSHFKMNFELMIKIYRPV